MLTVLIVDDHAIFRNGVARCLEETRPQVHCDEAGSGEEALRMAASGSYDLVFLDISLPGVSGLTVLKQLNREQPALPVLMLSVYPEEEYAIRALMLGACGYLTKESTCDELEAAVRQVLSGGRYISPSLATTVAALGYKDGKAALPHDALSNRETQVLQMIAWGKTSSQIAEELSLSVKTISTYRSRVFTKLKLSNNAELIKYTLKHRLIY